MVTQEYSPELTEERAASVAERDRHFHWNFAMMGIDIAFFSVGMTISSAYVVLPLFVHHLSSSNLAASFVPAVRSFGLFGTQLILAGYIEGLRRTKPILLIVTTLERLPFLILAGASLLLTGAHPIALLILFFVLILVQTLGSGLSMTPWLDLVARAIPDNWRGRFFGLSTGLGGILGIGGAALATFILASPDIGYPTNFALCFVITFGLMIISYFWLSLTREPRRIPHPIAQKAARRSAGEIGPRGWLQILRRDRGFRELLIANAITGTATLATGLFAISAKNVAHLSDAQVSVQNTVLVLSSTAGYFILGIIGDRYGHRRVLEIGTVAGGMAGVLALFAHDPTLYAGVFLCTGFSISASLLASFAFVIEFGPPEARPTYIALSSVCYAPFVTLAPLAGGWLADHLGYGPPFAIAAGLGLIAMIYYRSRVPDPRMDQRMKRNLIKPEIAS